MKKRILALALCLVMAVSLLPITAAAEETPVFSSVNLQGELVQYSNSSYYYVDIKGFTVYQTNGNPYTDIEAVTAENIYTLGEEREYLTTPPVEGVTYYVEVTVRFPNVLSQRAIDIMSPSFSANLKIPGYKTEYFYHFDVFLYDFQNNPIRQGIGLVFSLTKEPEHEHDWQFTKTDNSLTATCLNSGCPIGTVGVTLTANSVTLPDSPFNATLEVSENFKEAFPNAQVTGPKYQYKDSEKGWIDAVPGSFTPKAGQYQAQAYIDGLPGGGEIAARAVGNEDGIVGTHVDLWVDYTAVDPKVTAQTGDSRPIELMMAGVVVFSALAAAAFVLDSKRRSRQ